MKPMALARFLLSATTASAYVYGDGVRLRARTRLRGAEAAWSDCRQAASPRFRVKSDRALRGVPLPEAGAPLDAVELALAAGAAATPWLRLMENGRNLTSVELMMTHDGSQIVSIDARARYGEVDRKQARRDEKRRRRDGNSDIDRVAPAAFLPAVRVRYAWRGDASFRDAAAMRTAAGVSGSGGQGAPPASAEGGAGVDRTHQTSVRAASEALADFVQTLGGRPQADVPERWRRELLTSLVETAHSESEWAETVLANALGFAPSADAWACASLSRRATTSGSSAGTDGGASSDSSGALAFFRKRSAVP